MPTALHPQIMVACALAAALTSCKAAGLSAALGTSDIDVSEKAIDSQEPRTKKLPLSLEYLNAEFKGAVDEVKMERATWKDIWIGQGLKYGKALEQGGWEETNNGYERLVCELTKHIPTKIGDVVCEFGCGAGASLKAISKCHEGIQVHGLDLSPTLVAAAKHMIPSGTFYVANMLSPQVFDVDSCDHSVTFSSLQYLANESEVEMTLMQMYKSTKTAGTINVMDVLDASKTALANNVVKHKYLTSTEVAAHTGPSPSHLFVNRQLFWDFGKEHNIGVQLLADNAVINSTVVSYNNAGHRYSVFMTVDGASKQVDVWGHVTQGCLLMMIVAAIIVGMRASGACSPTSSKRYV